jgi:hypothetical protein
MRVIAQCLKLYAHAQAGEWNFVIHVLTDLDRVWRFKGRRFVVYCVTTSIDTQDTLVPHLDLSRSKGVAFWFQSPRYVVRISVL